MISRDPSVSVPAHEAWLFKNRRALAMVRRGLEDAKHGRFAHRRRSPCSPSPLIPDT